MPEILGWLVIFLFVAELLGVVDVNINIRFHVDGEQIVCSRGNVG